MLMKPELKKVSPFYPSHFMYDGNLYRGLRQEVIVKPDSNGLYKVKHKGDVFYRSIEEIFFLRKEDAHNEVKEDKTIAKNLCQLCKINNLDASTYRRWFAAQGLGAIKDYSMDEHQSFINKREKRIETKNKANLKQRCEENEVSYTSYKTFMRRNGISTYDLTPIGHDMLIMFFKDKKVRRRTNFQKDRDHVEKVKKSFGIRYE